MAAFLEIFEQRNSISDRFFAALEAANEVARAEFEAAIRIQGAFRRYQIRKILADKNKRAVIIQRNWRRLVARRLALCLRVEKETEDRKTYFNLSASKIQKAWREFVKRKGIVIEGKCGPEVPRKFPKIRRVVKVKRKRKETATIPSSGGTKLSRATQEKNFDIGFALESFTDMMSFRKFGNS